MALFWWKSLMKTLYSSLNTIACYCLPNSDVNIAGTLEEFFVSVSEKLYFYFKIQFLH